MSQRPALMRRPEYAGRAGRAGLVATGISVALTFVVAVAGTSIMEPPYPGRPGQPPWAVNAQLSPYLAIALAGGALAVGTMRRSCSRWSRRSARQTRSAMPPTAGCW